MKKILFTGGGGVGNEALWKLFSSHYDLYFADSNIEAINPCIPRERKILIPLATDKKFKAELKKISKNLKLDFIVPSVDEELVELADARNEFDADIFLPNVDFVKLMLNKCKCAHEISKFGLSAPVTQFAKNSSSIDFPLIVKPNSGRGSKGVMIVNSQKELDAYRDLYRLTVKDPIVQDLAIGQEYTVLVSSNNLGNLNSIIPIKVGQKKGITIRAKIDMNPLVIDYTKSFHKCFPTMGIYNIQCILTSKGIVLPFEINPRISTTFCISIAAGFDPFSEYYEKNINNSLFIPKEDLCLERNWVNNITSCKE